MCINHDIPPIEPLNAPLLESFRGAEAFDQEVYLALLAMCRAKRWVGERAMDLLHEVYLAWLGREVAADEQRTPGYHAYYLTKSIGSGLSGKIWRSKFGPMLCTPEVSDTREARPHFNGDGKLLDDSSRKHEYKHSHEDYVIEALDAAYRKDDTTRWRRALAKLYDDGWTSLQIAVELGVRHRRVTMWRGGVEAPLLRREDIVALAQNQPPVERRYHGTVHEYNAQRKEIYDRAEARRADEQKERDRETAERFAGDNWHGALLRLRNEGWTKKDIAKEMSLERSDAVGRWERGEAEPKGDAQKAIQALEELHRLGKRRPGQHASRRLDAGVAKEMRARGLSWREIARRMGCSAKGIQVAVEGPQKGRPGKSALDVEAAKKMRREGMTWTAIGQHLGCSDAGIKLAVERVALAEAAA